MSFHMEHRLCFPHRRTAAYCVSAGTRSLDGNLSLREKAKVTVISQDTVMMLALYPRESEIIQKEKSCVHMKQYGYNLISSLQFE
mgnify:CR=1 FL=1